MRKVYGFISIACTLALLPACVDQPSACFTTDREEEGNTIKVGLQIEFFSCSNDSETHHWDFGDSTVVKNAGPAIKHAYKKEGSHTVTLEVRNGTKTDKTIREVVVVP